MIENMLFSLIALASLLPSLLVSLRREHSRDTLYWTMLALAVAGPGGWVIAQMSGTWLTGLSMALWVTVAVSMAIFVVISVVTRQGWRLTPLITAYLMVIGVLAVIWQSVPEKPLAAAAPTGWIHAHILLSVTTYGLVTIAAVAALAAFLKERALKTKHPTALTHLLPSVVDCEFLLVRLLILSEIVLALGLTTGMAAQYWETGTLVSFDHKSIFSITTFVVIGGLLLAHYRSGVRGRMVTRLVLLAYLLLTLGYPGVKFVSDVILA